jgi:hypothetical protein
MVETAAIHNDINHRAYIQSVSPESPYSNAFLGDRKKENIHLIMTLCMIDANRMKQ